AETGLYYNRHRYYDAESGQYLSPDPIGLSMDKAAGLCSQSIGMG
ncbi:RHS repeat-associated core domain-containing protein, partial [Pectobacterium parmentieri]